MTRLPHIRVLLLVAALGIPLTARAQPAPADPVRFAAARRVLEASGAAELMITAMKASIPAQRAATPQLPAEFWSRFEERMVQDGPQLVDSIAALYAAIFTLRELQELTAFYQSPIGRRFRDAQGELMTQSTAIGQRWGMRIGQEIGAAILR
jgi:hypothetical protein